MKKILFYVFSFFLLQIGNINDALAVTYRLQRVTNVKAGEKYVFEQAGRVMNNTISKYALTTIQSYNIYGLTGGENYVWTLSGDDSSKKMNNEKAESTSGKYLAFDDSNLSFQSNSKATLWSFGFQSNGTVVIFNGNDVNKRRCLGLTTSNTYKAYQNGELGYQPHSIVVYKLVEESDTKTRPELKFSSAYVKVVKGNSFTSPTLNKASGFDGTIIYSSSNPSVATVNASTGAVSIVGSGIALVTASSEGTTTYDAGEATYMLVVMDGVGTEAKPHSVNDFLSGYLEYSPSTVFYVQGFIVGSYEETSDFTTTPSGNDNIAIADSPFGATWNNTTSMPLSGSLQTTLGLKNHPDLMGCWVVCSGTLGKSYHKTSLTTPSISLATSYPVTITSYKYASYRTPTKLDFSGMDVSAYTASVGGDNVVLTKIEDGIVPANKGVILYSETAGTYDVPVTDAATSLSDTGLSISDGSSATKESGIYVLGKKNGNVGFYRWIGDNSLPEGRVYLSPPAAARDYLSFMFDEETTKVEVSSHAACLSHERWSDLSGRSLTGRPTAKGVYVINGRKVVVK